MTTDLTPRPPAWSVLAHALIEGRTVRARYHGHDRLLCPHALGWKNGRAKVLAYQAAGSTSNGSLPPANRDRWRTLFVDEIHDATIVADAPWQTADNYTASSNGIDRLELIRPLN
jgi:hypothetical protein